MHRAPTISFDDSVCPAGAALRAARFAGALAFALALPAQAAVTPEEAAALGTTLTAVGA